MTDYELQESLRVWRKRITEALTELPCEYDSECKQPVRVVTFTGPSSSLTMNMFCFDHGNEIQGVE